MLKLMGFNKRNPNAVLGKGMAENYAKWPVSIGLNPQVNILSIVYRGIKGCLAFGFLLVRSTKEIKVCCKGP